MDEDERPHWVVARTTYSQNMAEGDIAWDDLSADQREDIADYVRDILGAHIEYLVDRGFRIVPPNASPIPRSEDEAMAMLQAAKAFFDRQRREGRLMSGSAPRAILRPN